MSTLISNSSVELVTRGRLNTKSWTLPGSATTQTLFTVTGGNILVTNLVGIVTTLIGATVTSLTLGTVPTTGTASSNGLATTTAVTSREVGTWLAVQQSAGAAAGLLVGTNAGTSLLANYYGFYVAPGTITATTSANAGGGVINWYLSWIALDFAASVS